MARVHEIDTEQPVWKRLAQMAEDHPQAGEAVENAADDDAKHVQPGLHGETVNGPVETAF